MIRLNQTTAAYIAGKSQEFISAGGAEQSRAAPPLPIVHTADNRTGSDKLTQKERNRLPRQEWLVSREKAPHISVRISTDDDSNRSCHAFQGLMVPNDVDMLSSAGLGNVIMSGNDGDGTVNTGQWQKKPVPPDTGW